MTKKRLDYLDKMKKERTPQTHAEKDKLHKKVREKLESKLKIAQSEYVKERRLCGASELEIAKKLNIDVKTLKKNFEEELSYKNKLHASIRERLASIALTSQDLRAAVTSGIYLDKIFCLEAGQQVEGQQVNLLEFRVTGQGEKINKRSEADK